MEQSRHDLSKDSAPVRAGAFSFVPALAHCAPRKIDNVIRHGVVGGRGGSRWPAEGLQIGQGSPGPEQSSWPNGFFCGWASQIPTRVSAVCAFHGGGHLRVLHGFKPRHCVQDCQADATHKPGPASGFRGRSRDLTRKLTCSSDREVPTRPGSRRGFFFAWAAVLWVGLSCARRKSAIARLTKDSLATPCPSQANRSAIRSTLCRRRKRTGQHHPTRLRQCRAYLAGILTGSGGCSVLSRPLPTVRQHCLTLTLPILTPIPRCHRSHLRQNGLVTPIYRELGTTVQV